MLSLIRSLPLSHHFARGAFQPFHEGERLFRRARQVWAGILNRTFPELACPYLAALQVSRQRPHRRTHVKVFPTGASQVNKREKTYLISML